MRWESLLPPYLFPSLTAESERKERRCGLEKEGSGPPNPPLLPTAVVKPVYPVSILKAPFREISAPHRSKAARPCNYHFVFMNGFKFIKRERERNSAKGLCCSRSGFECCGIQLMPIPLSAYGLTCCKSFYQGAGTYVHTKKS